MQTDKFKMRKAAPIEDSIHRSIEVAVLRAQAPQEGFRWELRKAGRAAAIEAGTEFYAAAAAAREAGEQALDQRNQRSAGAGRDL